MRTIVVLAASCALLAGSAVSANAQVLGQVTGTVSGTLHGALGTPPIALPAPALPHTPMRPLARKSAAQSMPMSALYNGTFESMSGSDARIRFADGSTQTFAVDAQTAVTLKASVGRPVAFHLVGRTLHLARNVMRGTLERIKGTSATILELGNTIASQYTVNAQTAAQISADAGKQIAFTLDGNTMIVASNEPPTNASESHANPAKSRNVSRAKAPQRPSHHPSPPGP